VGLWLIGIGLVTAALSGPGHPARPREFQGRIAALGVGFLLLVIGVLLTIIGAVVGSKRGTAAQKRYAALALVWLASLATC